MAIKKGSYALVFLMLIQGAWAMDDSGLARAMINSDETSCDELRVTEAQLVKLITAMKHEIARRVRNGEEVQFKNFGTFSMKHVPATEVSGRFSGRKEGVPAHDVVRFEPFDLFRAYKGARLADRQ